MAYDPDRVESRIKEILNAAATWGGAVTKAVYSAEGITAAREESQLEVLRAIAGNPQSGDYGALVTDTAVAHDALLPAFEGDPGIPLIVPFDGAPARAGHPATPDQIDAWRLNPEAYSGLIDGEEVEHNEADANGKMFPFACRYTIDNGRFKFTGFSAVIPLAIITRATAVPEPLEPVVVKLSIPKLVKSGTPLYAIAMGYGVSGEKDQDEIRGTRKPKISPMPDIETAQRMGAA